jgi:predicted nucleic acid-binding protein
MYLDSAYIAKFYLNEPDSAPVRRAIAAAESRVTSAWAIAEVTCTFHRKVREKMLADWQSRELMEAFQEHVATELWTLLPVTERLLLRLAARMKALPENAYVRSGDALHLITASDFGETEIWTNDRHLLAAAPYFGLTGRSV